jgi:antitoxin (DNA-binding transcriptional repressor) of toxin-antitoxin stability system
MKEMTVGEVKTHFSEVLKQVEAGQEVAITFGKKKEIKALLVPHKPKKQKRKLGLFKHKGSAKFIGGHNTTEKEFFGE